MNPADMANFIQDMSELMGTLNSLGLPGLLAILLIGPALVICLILWVNHNSTIRMENVLEVYRKDTQEVVSAFADKYDKVISIQKDLTSQLERYSMQNQTMQTLVINNTTAMEQLKCAVKSITG